MDVIDEPEDMVDRGLGHDPVAEVEDVAGAPGGPIEDPAGPSLDFLDGAEEDRGVEVALDGD